MTDPHGNPVSAQVMEAYLNGSEKQPQALIQDYKEYHTDVTVKFVVQMAADKMRRAETEKGLQQFFKLQVGWGLTGRITTQPVLVSLGGEGGARTLSVATPVVV